MKTVVHWRWRYYDEARRKWFKTGYTLSEEDAASRYPGAEKVPGSEVVREIAETDAERAAVMGSRHTRYQGPGESQG